MSHRMDVAEMLDDGKPITFTHGTGKEQTELTLVVDIPVMRRLRREYDIDLRYMLDKDDPKGGLIGRLMEDPGAIVDIAFEGTRKCRTGPETPDQFAEGLAGDILDELTYKVLAAVIRFTPDRSARTGLAAILHKVGAAGDKIRAQALETIQGGKLDSVIEQAIRELETKPASDSTPDESTSGSTGSPSVSDSTPTPSSKGGRSGGSKAPTASES